MGADRFRDEEAQQEIRELEASRQIWKQRWERSQEDLRAEIDRGNRWTLLGLFLGLVAGAMIASSVVQESRAEAAQECGSCR